ncbi:MAG: radical SAM protein, partial [Candidatus Hydrogenedentes bacterium]|nr:radical SAM protein [Candidatus Hydrogenedentota bacterium]
YVVRGEGEAPMSELIEHLLSGGTAAGIAGISWVDRGRIVHNPDRPFQPNLEKGLYPDWSLFPIKHYSSLARRNDHSLPITTSRGCPFGCTFCYKGIYGRRLRMRQPEDVVGEWEHLVRRYGVREIAVLDDAFTFDVGRAIRICELIVERGLAHVPWSTTNGIRVDNVTPELFQAMRRAGCYRVYFGIESGVQSVLDSLKKGITIEQVRRAITLANQSGLEVGGYFMLGNVGETADDMEATIKFALQLDLDYAQFSIATPYPGTEMFEQVRRGGRLLIRSWEELATYGAAVFEMDQIDPAFVGRMFRKAIRRFYFRPRYMLHQMRELMTWTGWKHRALAGLLLVRLALFGGRAETARARSGGEA